MENNKIVKFDKAEEALANKNIEINDEDLAKTTEEIREDRGKYWQNEFEAKKVGKDEKEKVKGIGKINKIEMLYAIKRSSTEKAMGQDCML